MEVCGTHTMAIAKMGLREALRDKVRLVSGPGCPVCVTSECDIAKALELASRKDVIITTFGDMMRVPSGKKSLLDLKAQGANIRVVYSPLDSLSFALENPQKLIVFLAVGFETTIPAIAATIIEARKLGINNFTILPLMKTIPVPLRFLCERIGKSKDSSNKIDGFILPGHVSAIIGISPYRFIAGEFGIPAVVAGFTENDVADCLIRLIEMANKNEARLENSYSRAVSANGNPKAIATMNSVFAPSDANWRGIGALPDSGLKLRSEFSAFDIELRLGKIAIPKIPEKKNCLCGRVILGEVNPSECPNFAKICTPENPLGPCMVSSEGACAAEYKYGLA